MTLARTDWPSQSPLYTLTVVKLRRVLKWIGICGIGLFLGLIIGAMAQGIIAVIIPYEPGENYNPDTSYDQYEERMHYLGIACFAWSAAAFVIILGLRSARFHVLFGHGLAMLSLSLYLIIETYSILRLISSSPVFQSHQAWEQYKIFKEYKQYEATGLFGLSVFFIMIGLVMLMAALIADRSEQERQRALRRQKRFLD